MQRALDELRPIKVKRGFTKQTPGSVLYQSGETVVLCTVSIDPKLPPWMGPAATSGWITAEYNMLPGSTPQRKARDRQKVDGRTTEIQRLIGRSLRAVVDLAALGPRQLLVDCDVLQADGGTRTASINGSLIALVDAIESIKKDLPDPQRYPLKDSLAAISVGIVGGRPCLDLCYEQDVAAEVDMNVVMTGGGRFVELQGTGEEATFSDRQLNAMLKLAKSGIDQILEAQRVALGKLWPFAD